MAATQLEAASFALPVGWRLTRKGTNDSRSSRTSGTARPTKPPRRSGCARHPPHLRLQHRSHPPRLRCRGSTSPVGSKNPANRSTPMPRLLFAIPAFALLIALPHTPVEAQKKAAPKRVRRRNRWLPSASARNFRSKCGPPNRCSRTPSLFASTKRGRLRRGDEPRARRRPRHPQHMNWLDEDLAMPHHRRPPRHVQEARLQGLREERTT